MPDQPSSLLSRFMSFTAIVEHDRQLGCCWCPVTVANAMTAWWRDE